MGEARIIPADRPTRMSLSVTQTVPCPRCHEACGWCGDYRFMHRQLRLPGTKRRCGVPGLEPEGEGCPLCTGTLRVIATTTYAANGDASGLASRQRPAGLSSDPGGPEILPSTPCKES